MVLLFFSSQIPCKQRVAIMGITKKSFRYENTHLGAVIENILRLCTRAKTKREQAT